MRSIFRVYVKFNGLNKRERKVKFHSIFIDVLNERPTADKMLELEKKAKKIIFDNYKKFDPTFEVEAQHCRVDEGIMQRMIFGDPLDVKHTGTI